MKWHPARQSMTPNGVLTVSELLRSVRDAWEPRDGAQVEVRALVTLYEPRGRFQLTVEGMRPAGLGPLYERFLRLKEKLEREGLFDLAAKRELPAFAGCIGVLTS